MAAACLQSLGKALDGPLKTDGWAHGPFGWCVRRSQSEQRSVHELLALNGAALAENYAPSWRVMFFRNY